jgi:hypothetical protein
VAACDYITWLKSKGANLMRVSMVMDLSSYLLFAPLVLLLDR